MIKESLFYIIHFLNHISVMVLWLGGLKRHRYYFPDTKKAIRAIFGLKFSESNTDAFSTLKMLTVHQLYKYTCASLIWDFDHGHLPKHISKFCIKTSNFHTINTRVQPQISLHIQLNI